MTWQNELIANPMGFEYCVLFDSGRDALKAALKGIGGGAQKIPAPVNICPSIAHLVSPIETNPQTGLAPDYPVHLYGYQGSNSEDDEIALDPLMTGWLRHIRGMSSVVSFGHKKMLSIGYGGAFLTNDSEFFDTVEEHWHWNDYYTDHLRAAVASLHDEILERRDVVDLWDRHLGDALSRVPQEQIMPWRVMRRAEYRGQRDVIVDTLRTAQLPVGTNYQPLTGRNPWGDLVLNFPCSLEVEKADIILSCDIIKKVVDNG